MDKVTTISVPMATERNNNISNTIKEVSRRLLDFIKKQVKHTEDAEDILQEVLYQFAGNTTPVEQTTAWLYKVARNKITDRHRKHKLPLADDVFGATTTNDETFNWQEVLLPAEDNAETAYLRNLFWDALYNALDELPEEQRFVFIQHEIEDIAFKDIAAQTGESVATLISRKRYAVLHLRNRLQKLKDELLNY
jgi:RNA polymerase sigma factor (sigma-70 family)